jgi:endonuclease/exonuclease/phosphatase family metal-dependent hydrolase
MEFKQHPPAGGLAVLSKMPIESIDYLPPTSWFPAARVILQTPVGRIQVLNVHLRPPASDKGNVVSGYFITPPIREQEISTFVAALDPNLPTLIVGDFNEGEHGRAVRWLSSHGFRSALPEFQPQAKTWRWATSVGTLRGDYDHLCYDGRLQPISAEVRNIGQSDHLPVVGIFTIAPTTQPSGEKQQQ